MHVHMYIHGLFIGPIVQIYNTTFCYGCYGNSTLKTMHQNFPLLPIQSHTYIPTHTYVQGFTYVHFYICHNNIVYTHIYVYNSTQTVRVQSDLFKKKLGECVKFSSQKYTYCIACEQYTSSHWIWFRPVLCAEGYCMLSYFVLT